MALKDLSEGRTDVYKIDPRKIKIKDSWNNRDMSDPANQEHVNQLALSIAEIGVKKPLTVFMEGELPYIEDGECRLRATWLAIERGADIKSVPVMGSERFANEADRIFSQIVHNQGKPLTGLEQAKVFKRLMDLGWSQKDIALKAGISGGRVSQLLELLTLPISLQMFITEGKASANMVLMTFKKFNGDEKATLEELSGAVEKAQESGRKRAMPKDTEGGEGGSEKPAKSPKANLKAHLKALIEKAYVDENIDDSENTVTWSVSETDWAELMEMIDY